MAPASSSAAVGSGAVAETSFAEKLRSLSFHGTPRRERPAKVTRDDHGTHVVTVTEHYDDRVDVHAGTPHLRVKGKGTVHGA